jgi:hypothetical protein
MRCYLFSIELYAYVSQEKDCTVMVEKERETKKNNQRVLPIERKEKKKERTLSSSFSSSSSHIDSFQSVGRVSCSCSKNYYSDDFY